MSIGKMALFDQSWDEPVWLRTRQAGMPPERQARPSDIVIYKLQLVNTAKLHSTDKKPTKKEGEKRRFTSLFAFRIADRLNSRRARRPAGRTGPYKNQGPATRLSRFAFRAAYPAKQRVDWKYSINFKFAPLFSPTYSRPLWGPQGRARSTTAKRPGRGL